jgi:hypothetical protein
VESLWSGIEQALPMPRAMPGPIIVSDLAAVLVHGAPSRVIRARQT